VTRNSLVRVLACSGALALVQGCSGGDGGGGGDDSPPPPTTGISGIVSYERVPFEASSTGLDYASTFEAPARGVVVQLLDAAGAAIDSTITDATGAYEFPDVPADTDVRVRARARLLRHSSGGGEPGWDVEVRNNTNGNAAYVLDGELQNSGSGGQTRDLLAESGWSGFGGSTYSGTRAAAPFAIVDTLYEAVRFVVDNGDAAIVLEPLDVYWSPQNRPVSGDGDYSDGQIGSTGYHIAGGSGSPTGIYVLGDDGLDTDEYDEHVLVHEFGHYLEHTVSRTDSIGGIHGQGDLLDLRVAFSEGYNNAFSGMVLDDPEYRDSMGAAQGQEFSLDLEENTRVNPGWFSEMSVASIVWDLFDTQDDGADRTSVGFGPLFDVFVNELRETPALTSIFVLIAGLKERSGVDTAAIDAIVAAQSIVAAPIDPYGSSETHDGGIDEALPVYTSLALNGPTRQVCGSATDIFYYNTLGNRRFLSFNVPSARTIEIRVVGLGTAGATYPGPDPDLLLYQNGLVAVSDCAGPGGGSCTEPQNTELLELVDAPAGDYVLEVYDYSHIDPSQGLRPTTCMNVSLTG
jgi:hypothetical protein